MSRKHFRLKRIALGLAFAAVAVPTAQAEPVAYTPVSQLVNAPASQPLGSGISVKSTENRPGITAAGTAIANAKHSAYPVQVAQTQAAGSGGFNWGDAGIGASISLGVVLMLLMAVVLGRRYRSRPTGLAST